MTASTAQKHLFLSLGRKGFGEAGLGLQLAGELRDAGQDVYVLAHDSNASLLQRAFPHLTFNTASSPLLPLYIGNCLSTFRASSIILSDYFTATLFFECFGLSPETLSAFDLPIVAIDTWDSSKVSGPIDVLVKSTRDVVVWPEKVKPICPVPFLAPTSTNGAYASLPSVEPVPTKIRRHLHHTLGIAPHEKAVLFCTAEWQHPNYDSEDDVARRIAASVPTLLAEYLKEIDGVHLVHVGPRSYRLERLLGGRYHWLPPLPPTEFNPLVGSMDLLLTANISATTIAKAMMMKVPVLAVQNSVSAATRDEALALLEGKVSPNVDKWLAESLPIFPFTLWPLGYHRFLQPILAGNPYVEALQLVELLDHERLVSSLRRLLFDPASRESQVHRQEQYLDTVRSLPTGAQIVSSTLGA